MDIAIYILLICVVVHVVYVAGYKAGRHDGRCQVIEEDLIRLGSRESDNEELNTMICDVLETEDRRSETMDYRDIVPTV